MGELVRMADQVARLEVNCLRDLASLFLENLDAGENTRRSYAAGIDRFISWAEREGVALTRQAVISWRRALEEAGYSPYTVGSYMTAVRRFFAFLEAEGIYPNVALGVKGTRRPKGFCRDILTDEQARRLLETIRGRTREEALDALRDYALINLLLRTGVRTVEVARANVGDIGTEGNHLVLRIQGKGRDAKDDFVLLTDPAYGPLMDYLQARGSAEAREPLFCSHSNRNRGERLTTRSIRRIVGRRLREAGLKTERISAHSLRHTAGTNALAHGADLLSVKEMLRHKDINTTLIYARNLKRVAAGAEHFITY